MVVGFNYYYNTLHPGDQEIYLRIKDGLFKKLKEIDLRVSLDPDKVFKIFRCVMNDNHLLYYVNDELVYCTPGLPTKLTVNYYFNNYEIERYQSKIDDEILSFIKNNFKYNMNAFQKEMKIIEYLTNRVTYNFNALVKPDFRAHNIVGTFIEKTSVCEGIAESAKLLFDYAGIPCIYISGDAKSDNGCGKHGWNMVKLEGEWYQCDITWSLRGNNILHYDYINLTDSEMHVNHFYSGYPECKAVKYNLFRMNDCYCAINSKEEIRRIFSKQLNMGKREFSVKFETYPDIEILKGIAMELINKRYHYYDDKIIKIFGITLD